MRDLGGGRHDGPCALTGFVAVDAAFHAPGDGAAQQGPAHLVDAHGTAQHLHEDIGYQLPVDDEHDNGEDDVDQCHDGGDDLRHVGDAFHATDDDQCQQGGHHHADHPGRDAERL